MFWKVKNSETISPPPCPKPYEIVVKGINTVYGMTDIKFVESLKRAKKVDQTRQIVEWLEYDLLVAKRNQFEAKRVYEMEDN